MENNPKSLEIEHFAKRDQVRSWFDRVFFLFVGMFLGACFACMAWVKILSR